MELGSRTETRSYLLKLGISPDHNNNNHDNHVLCIQAIFCKMMILNHINFVARNLEWFYMYEKLLFVTLSRLFSALVATTVRLDYSEIELS